MEFSDLANVVAKNYGPLLVQCVVFIIYVVRSESVLKSRIGELEKENSEMKKDLEKIQENSALDKDFVEFKARQKEHDLTLWAHIDGIRSDIKQILRSLARVEVMQELISKE